MSAVPPSLESTRRALHAVAEHLLAGPQHRSAGTIRLAVGKGGFSTLDGDRGVDGAEVVLEPSGARTPISGTVAAIGERLGIDTGAPEGLYHDGSGVAVDEPLAVDPTAAEVVCSALALGDQALRALAERHGASTTVPVLWPEHFDVGISLEEVNYGVSPGDAVHPEPYAYVGPHAPRQGDFWTEPFGASLPLGGLDADAVLAFFEEGHSRAASDPHATSPG